jgi:hypothetical protein
VDWLNETPAYTFLAPQLMWIKILEVCAAVLLVTALLMLLTGWLRHCSLRVQLIALLPLAASVGVGIAVLVLHGAYVYWVDFVGNLPVSFPLAYQNWWLGQIAKANNTATVLGWVSVAVTGVVLVLSLVGFWRLVMLGRQNQLPASLAMEH